MTTVEARSASVDLAPDALLTRTAEQIDQMSMEDRLELIRAVRSGPATELGVGDRWKNIEGVIAFFAESELGAPGSWISWVNAGVLESILRGIAVAQDPEADTYDNPGTQLWADYVPQQVAGELVPRNHHDKVWGDAKRVCTDYGIKLAERHGKAPTDRERKFLELADTYNWAMRNRDLVNGLLRWAWLVDARLKDVTPEFVDRWLSVGSTAITTRSCRVAWVISGEEGELLLQSGNFRQLLDLGLSYLPQILGAGLED